MSFKKLEMDCQEMCSKIFPGTEVRLISLLFPRWFLILTKISISLNFFHPAVNYFLQMIDNLLITVCHFNTLESISYSSMYLTTLSFSK